MRTLQLQLQHSLGSPIAKQQQARLRSDDLFLFSIHVDMIGVWAMSPRCDHINRSQVGRSKVKG